MEYYERIKGLREDLKAGSEALQHNLSRHSFCRVKKWGAFEKKRPKSPKSHSRHWRLWGRLFTRYYLALTNVPPAGEESFAGSLVIMTG